MNKNPLLVPELREILDRKDGKAIREFCESAHPVAIAEFISALESEEIWSVLQYADAENRAEIFSNLDEDTQVDIVLSLRREAVAKLLGDMHPDDRVDLFKKLPQENRDLVLPALAQAEREDIRRLIAYEEGTAGSVMTSDYATLLPQQTAGDAIERLREIAPDRETIYDSYVVDENRKLIGSVSLRDLIIARRGAKISDIMNPEVISARVDDDQEHAARKLQKYDLIALPVVDAQDAIVGIITHDDAIDIITQEQTEDFEKLMAIGGTHEAGVYMKTSSWEHYKNRVFWLVFLAAIGMISGFIVHRFEDLLLQFAILATFMPMLADTGGNTGSQSATLVIRALALNEVKPGSIFKILLKEFKVSILMGITLAILAYGRVFLFGASGDTTQSIHLIGFAIALALGLQVITSTLIGALLPLIANKFKLDPAVVASPAITTTVDITGLLIFFTIAKWLLGV